MRIQSGEIRRAMDGGKGVMPQRPGLMGARLKILDALARVLTFGRWAHLCFSPRRFEIGNNRNNWKKQLRERCANCKAYPPA